MRWLVDLGVVLADLLTVVAVTATALTVVLVGGMAVHITAGPLAGALFVNEGLVLVVLGLLGWLIFFGRHRYEPSRGGRR